MEEKKEPQGVEDGQEKHITASNGWVLYYDEDGYPYYYNAEREESVWAQEAWQYDEFEHEEAVSPSLSDEKEELYNIEEDPSETESSSSRDSDLDSSSDDEDELDETFQAMLATPQGQAALGAEIKRAARALDKSDQKMYQRWLDAQRKKRRESRLFLLMRIVLFDPLQLSIGWLIHNLRHAFFRINTSPRKPPALNIDPATNLDIL